MSNLQGKLGPQGRSLLNQQSFTEQRYPQDLDFLINELRFIKPGTTIPKILGYMYHYLPFVKQEFNLRLVIASFLNNSLCFGPNGAPYEENYLVVEVFKLITDKKLHISQPTLSIKAWYRLVLSELTNFVWYNPYVNSWKALPILTGILLSNELRDDLYSHVNPVEYNWFFKSWDRKAHHLLKKCLQHAFATSVTNNDDKMNLSILCLAITYRRGDDLKRLLSGNLDTLLIERLIDLTFVDPNCGVSVYQKFFSLDTRTEDPEKVIQHEIMQKPIVKHISKISFLLEEVFKHLPFDRGSHQLIMESLLKIQSFNQKMCSSTESSVMNENPTGKSQHSIAQSFWYFMKSLLFSEIVIFQGILTRFLSANASNDWTFSLTFFKKRQLERLSMEYREICLKILHNLYYVNHILFSIGQGGFDNYNFVYYMAVDIAHNQDASSSQYEQLSRYLIGNYQELNLHPASVNNNYISRCKILFVLGLWENYIQQHGANLDFINKEIFPISLSLVDDLRYSDPDLIEAGHSVLLVCFSSSKVKTSVEDSIDYVRLLTRQFPKLLSSNQLSIAIETIGKRILSSAEPTDTSNAELVSPHRFLSYVYLLCLETIPGRFIKPHASQQDLGFTSAQPISEIDAASTLSHLDEETNKESNIVSANKSSKPKDVVNFKLPTQKTLKKYKVEKRTQPETTREAMIVSLINLIPYLPLSIFLDWLNRTWVLILQSNLIEQTFLTDALWKVVSENLDLNRCELAYIWWYEVKKLSLSNRNKLLKL